MSASHVAVVVLSWNGREDTLACLASLRRVEWSPLTVVIIDNASDDGSATAVRAAFPEVEVIETGANLGFAGGNNVGLRRALELGADYVLVLNNDTEVDPACVAALVAEAERRLAAGAFSAKILFAEPPGLVWFAGAALDPRRGYHGRHRGYRQEDDGRFEEVVEIDRGCGAAMFFPRGALEEVGLLDEELFLYCEDAEWSLRARRAGRPIFLVPAARVRHRISAGSGGESAPATLYYDLRNLLRICERHSPRGPVGTWWRRLVVLGAHAAQALRSPRRREGLAAVWEGWRDFRRGRFGARGTPPRGGAPTPPS